MQIPLKYMQVHNPLFLAGVNLGTKLDITRRPELSMTYDREFAEVHVLLKGVLSILPLPAVSDMIPIDASQFLLQPLPAKEPSKEEVMKSIEAQKRGPGRPVKAQASSPLDHVFAEGPGKIRD